MGSNMMLSIIAAAIMLVGIFLAVKGKPHMIRERFSSGVSPENERKFMMTIGGAIVIIGLDMLALVLLSMKMTVTEEMTLIILAVGLVLFVTVILIGQKYFRR